MKNIKKGEHSLSWHWTNRKWKKKCVNGKNDFFLEKYESNQLIAENEKIDWIK